MALQPDAAKGSSIDAETPTYTVNYRCQDHESLGAGHVQKCTGVVNIEDMNGFEFVEVRAINEITYATTVRTIHHAADGLKGRATVSTAGESRLTYGDAVIVTATGSDGETSVLDRHTFSCKDVGYKNACEGNNE